MSPGYRSCLSRISISVRDMMSLPPPGRRRSSSRAARSGPGSPAPARRPRRAAGPAARRRSWRSSAAPAGRRCRCHHKPPFRPSLVPARLVPSLSRQARSRSKSLSSNPVAAPPFPPPGSLHGETEPPPLRRREFAPQGGQAGAGGLDQLLLLRGPRSPEPCCQRTRSRSACHLARTQPTVPARHGRVGRRVPSTRGVPHASCVSPDPLTIRAPSPENATVKTSASSFQD